MSIKIMTEVWEYAPCEETELLILLALADMSNDERDCWPSEKRLQGKGRCSWRKLEAILASLTTKHIIRMESRQRKDGGKASNLYHINEIEKWIDPSTKTSPKAVDTPQTPPSTTTREELVDTPQPDHAKDGLSPSTKTSPKAVDESSVLNLHSESSQPRKRLTNISRMTDAQLTTYHDTHSDLLDKLLLLTGIDVQWVHWGEMDLTQRRRYVQSLENFYDKNIVYDEYVVWLKGELSWRPNGQVTLRDFLDNIPRYRTSLHQQKQASEPRGKTKLDESVELQRMMAAEARGEVWNG